MFYFPARKVVLLLTMLSAGMPVATGLPADSAGSRHPVLLIVFDGLRPDYVAPERMPNLYAWGRGGVVFEKHHATFPTVTRVNASSISTGAYPEQHGIADNSVYFPGVEPDKALSTGSRGNLETIDAHTGGNLLTAPTLGELLAAEGLKTVVFSSGSSGSAFLLNHKVNHGAIVNTEFVLPASLADTVLQRMGPEPAEAAPNWACNARIVNGYLDLGMNELDADLTLMWISDPDHTAHEHGMATAKTTQALRLDDDLFGRILAKLDASGRLATTNILVTSDHGFSTHEPPDDQKAVFEEFAKAHQLPDNAIIVTGSCIYVKEPYKEHVPALVAALQQTAWVGPLFTRAQSPGSIEGWVAGTLSLDLARAAHAERAPDILLSSAWTDDEGAPGFPGTVATGGVAGHGSASPWDVHNTLMARGPAFGEQLLIGLPSHNTDLAPTICHLLGVAPAATMTDRVLIEAMNEVDPEAPAEVTKRVHHTATALADGSKYHVELIESAYRGVSYFDEARGWRE